MVAMPIPDNAAAIPIVRPLNLYAGLTGSVGDSPWLSPAIELLNSTVRRRAQILGRAILLAYRLSGSVSEVLAGSRLSIEPDCLRLEVGGTARAPDSEVVGARLKLLAVAMGMRRFEVTERATS